jgi:hypothetical protein
MKAQDFAPSGGNLGPPNRRPTGWLFLVHFISFPTLYISTPNMSILDTSTQILRILTILTKMNVESGMQLTVIRSLLVAAEKILTDRQGADWIKILPDLAHCNELPG